MMCQNCERLRAENSALRKQNEELSSALFGQLGHSNTDLILGAALSGGDPIAIAKKLSGK